MTFSNLLERPYCHYLDFHGRSSRAEFWLFMVITMGLMYAMDALHHDNAVLIVSLVTIIPNVSVTIRRLHDANLSGWWCLLCFLPSHIGLAVQALIGLVPPTKGPNKYGDPPVET